MAYLQFRFFSDHLEEPKRARDSAQYGSSPNGKAGCGHPPPSSPETTSVLQQVQSVVGNGREPSARMHPVILHCPPFFRARRIRACVQHARFGESLLDPINLWLFTRLLTPFSSLTDLFYIIEMYPPVKQPVYSALSILEYTAGPMTQVWPAPARAWLSYLVGFNSR